MFRAGKHRQKVRKRRADRLLIPTGVSDENGEAIFITAAEIPGFFTEEFWEAYEFYVASETMAEFGAQPFSGGWTTWPEPAVSVLLLFKQESTRCEIEEMKARGVKDQGP